MSRQPKPYTPCPVPRHTAEGLEVDVRLASMLLEFAADEEFEARASLYGIGLDDCHLAATDGHTAARVLGCDPNGFIPTARNGLHWPREYVEVALDVAKAAKVGTITLRWDACGPNKFPALAQLIPAEHKISSAVPLGINPVYLSRLTAAARAVQGNGRDGYSPGVELVHTPRVSESKRFGPTLNGPFVFLVPGRAGEPLVSVEANTYKRTSTPRKSPDIEVAIMPMRSMR